MAEKRGNLYSYDPITDIAIIGGKSLPASERGELDTDLDENDPLHDERLALELAPEFVLNINALGVQTPILIVKRDGVPYVVAGRQRLRAARRVNREREKRGEPALRIGATLVQATGDARLMGAMIAENENRVSDSYSAKVSKIKRLMERGVGQDDAAIIFGVKPSVVKAWLAFEENAIDSVKAAVHSGELPITSGIEILRGSKTPDAQAKAFETLMAGPERTVRGARDAAKTVRTGKSKDEIEGVPDRRTQGKLLQACLDKETRGMSEKTLAFWEGVENALMLILGDKEADKRLVEMLARIRKASK